MQDDVAPVDVPEVVDGQKVPPAHGVTTTGKKRRDKPGNFVGTTPPGRYGRFTLVRLPDPQAGPSHTAIDGDLAVFAARGFAKDTVACGAVYIYERLDGHWVFAQRLDSPRPDMGGFARLVGIAAGRVVVFGGMTLGINQEVFRTYVRGADGTWKLEQEIPFGEPQRNDALARGDSIVVGGAGLVRVWRLRDGIWTEVQRITTPEDAPRSFGRSVHLAGDTLAVGAVTELRLSRGLAYVYRRGEGGYEFETRLLFEEHHPLKNEWWFLSTLARDGDALVRGVWERTLCIEERGKPEWTRALQLAAFWDRVDNNCSLAADGAIVVAASAGWPDFVILQRRDDGWYRTSVAPRTEERLPGYTLAMSGRTVVAATTRTDEWPSYGRAWFFDITDEDLARATKLESDPK